MGNETFYGDGLIVRLNQLLKPNHMVHSYGTRNINKCYIPYRSSGLGQYSVISATKNLEQHNSKLTIRQKILSQFFLLKSVLSKNFFLSRTMTVEAKNSPINNYFSFQSYLLLQCTFHKIVVIY